MFGTPVTPTTNLPWTGIPIQPDPGLFYPKASVGQRDANTFPLYGQYKFGGSVDGPVFPTNAIPILVAAIGADGGRAGQVLGAGVTGSTPSAANTLAGATLAGATTVTLTSATGYVATNFIQIDANLTGVTSSEVRKILSVSTNTLTLDAPLNFAHASGAATARVVGPFTHTVVRQNVLDSLTVEKNFGGYQSLQYAGTRVNKYGLKLDATNTEAHFTADMMSQNYVILGSPSPVALVNEAPYVFAEYSLSFLGTNLVNTAACTLNIENGLKDTFTFNQAHTLQYLTALNFKASGTLDAIWNSLNDATYGYFAKTFAGVSGALSITLAHPAGAGTIVVNLPEVRISKPTDDVKFDGLIMTQLSYEAEFQFSSSSTITASISNGVWLPY